MMHADFMHRCLALAARGRKLVGNGALVGSVLVREGKIIAEGFHESFGTSHAERNLLENFKGDIQPTDVLYVNLEPCCHTGKTPACTDIILERGIKHIVIGMLDPDVRVAGKGIEILWKNGVMVEGPMLRASSEWLNMGFISVRTKGRPWITIKSARVMDGSIAQEDGSPLAITTEEQNRWSHAYLRSRHDAILVGVQTVINDDPRLDRRFSTPLEMTKYQPWRIVLDPHLRIPKNARILTDAHTTSTIILTTEEKMSDAQLFLRSGALVLPVKISGNSFDWDDLWKTLLASHGTFNGLTSILVEGGQRTWNVFREAKMVDTEVILMG